MKTLKVYLDLRTKFREFRDKHQALFAEADALQAELAAAESALKAEVREAGKGFEDDDIVVMYSPAYREWYDYKAITKIADPKELALITDKAVTIDVDRKKFEALVKSGVVSMDVERKAFRRDELTPRVLIKEKDHEIEA